MKFLIIPVFVFIAAIFGYNYDINVPAAESPKISVDINAVTSDPIDWNGSEGAFIPIDDALAGLEAYRNSESYTANGGTLSHYFGGDKIKQILSMPEVIGIRAHYGKSQIDDPNRLVKRGDAEIYLVPVDRDGNNVFTDAKGNSMVLDVNWPCPYWCPKDEKDTKGETAPSIDWNGSEGDFISIETVNAGLDEYLNSASYESNGGILSHYHGGEKILKLLSEPGAVGLRIHYSKRQYNDDIIGVKKGDADIFLMPVDAAGNDMMSSSRADFHANADGNILEEEIGSSLVLDTNLPCPIWCPKDTKDSKISTSPF